MRQRQLRLLTIAGSDSGGGAGIQADLRTFAAHGAFGMSAVTALTAQNTLGVRAIELVSPAFVVAQIDAVFEDLPPHAIKIGMLGASGIVEAVASRLAELPGPPVVLDPVMIAASGDLLLAGDAVAALRDRLAPRATLMTPNLPEAEWLGEVSTRSLLDRRELARRLGAYCPAVLLKGGHAPDDPIVDLLWDGVDLHEIRHPRIATRAGHGTGCTLSSAIAVRLARGETLLAACSGAVEWLTGALRHAAPMGGGAGPLDQLWRWREEEDFA